MNILRPLGGSIRGRVVSAAIVGFAICAAAGAADIPDLHVGGDLHEGIGQGDTQDLKAGVVYRASTFPVGLRFSPPDAQWGGAQFQSGRFTFVQLAHRRTGNIPLHGVGYVTLEAAKGKARSVETAIASLHATPHIVATAIVPVHVAGFSGESFDATIVGADLPPYCRTHQCARGVSFAPFTANHHCGFCTNTMHGETQDVKFAGTGEVFRVIAIDVHGKTVVIYLEANFADQPKYPPAKVFPTFVPYAEKLLATLKAA